MFHKLCTVLFLSSFSFAFANINIDKGDINYAMQNYRGAIENYKKAYEQTHPKARIKLIMSYLKLGDNFNKTKRYDKALDWYNKALDLKSKVAQSKISKVYENQGDMYAKVKKHKTALELYTRSLNLGNTKVKSKIKISKKALDHKKQLKNDTRKLVTNNSPLWTKSIGRIIVPTKLEFITSKKYKTNYKKCSASLINIDGFNSSRVVVTASHCLTNYNEKAGEIRFIIKNSKSEMIQRYVKVNMDSNYSTKNIKTVSDYAILLLDKKISNRDVPSLNINSKNFLKLKNDYKYSFASLGGFSSDVGEYGARLTFDPKCQVNYHSYTYGASTCSGFKGASGGPIVMSVSDDDIKYDYYFIGVVSHFKNKNFKNIYFAPHDLFYNDLVKTINRYNK